MNVTEPAFPRIGIETDPKTDPRGELYAHVYSYEEAAGLTKRELFAAMALQGLLTRPFTLAMQNESHAAERAVIAADALIEALLHSGGKQS